MPVRVRLPNPLAALDDRALLARFAADRDQPAFELLVKRHGGLVFGVCKRAVRDLHLAEDAFQAVFLVLARNPDGARTAASVGGWLFGVARRVGLAARRHAQRREKREWRCREPDAGAAVVSGTDVADFLRVLDEELAALPAESRAALVACFLEERTQDEAARELGWSLSTLRRRLDSGKELLRARLTRRGVSLAVGLLAGAVAAPARAAVPALAPVNAHSPVSAALAREVLRSGFGAKFVAVLTATVFATGGLAFALTGDATEPPVPAAPLVAAARPVPAPAPVPRPVAVKKWATVSGRVLFPKSRDLPERKLVPANGIKDADAWKPFAPLRYEDTLVNPDNRGVANVVVFLRPDSDDRKAEFPADSIHPNFAHPKATEHTVLATAGQFTPRVLAVRAGDRVAFHNQLPVPTNVRYDSSGADDFNVLLGKGMAHTSKPLAAERAPDRYSSTIHPWMTGYVWVFDHPYFAVTDADGRFEIPNAPAGTWRLVAWHEAGGYLGGAGRLGTKLTVPESRTGKHELDPLTFANDLPE